jgi:hypothetical protein
VKPVALTLTLCALLASPPVLAQDAAPAAGPWHVDCAGKKCSISQSAHAGGIPATLRISAGPVVTIDGATFGSSGVVVFALDGMQTTFLPIGPQLRDADRRIVIGPNEISRELVVQFSHGKQATITLPTVGKSDVNVEFDLKGFAAAFARVKG